MSAVREGDHWRLEGEKWFCSEADAEGVMLLARPQGASEGTRGVGLLLMPRRLDDGSQNYYRTLAWEGAPVHEMRGDGRGLLLSRLVVDHPVSAGDPFRLTENAARRKITAWMLGDHDVAVSEVGELLSAT
jgi:alkylation response protein AidB-like acyl-CoA dehydrogenase